MTERTLFHIVDRARWRQARSSGRYVPESLAAEGFVHCCYLDQVVVVANALYRDATDLVVVEFDPGLVDAPIVVEDLYSTGTAYPHVYGPIPVRAQIGEHAVVRGADGRWRLAS